MGNRLCDRRHTALCRTALVILGCVLDGKAKGRPPSVRELCRAAGVTIRAVALHLARLRRLGLVAWEPLAARTVVPTCRFEAC